MRTMTDWWVVGKKSDQREFYVAINQKNANLIEINGELQKAQFLLIAAAVLYKTKPHLSMHTFRCL